MIIDDIALTLERGINPSVVIHLVGCFGTAQAVYEASEQQLIDRAELSAKLAAQLMQKQNHKQAQKEIDHFKRHGITAVESTSPYYPQLLKECDDYPHVIYVKGDLSVLSAPMITMVGTRNITKYGDKTCDALIQALAKIMPELVVVSGLAYGNDVSCHRAALRYGLRTIGVVASCLPAITPVHHNAISEEMIRCGGCIISDINTTFVPHKGQYQRRNRILAGLSAGTVIIESMKSGGSLITARLADDYNRVVMAVPGRIDDLSSEGTNSLIRRFKARMVCSAADIADEMGWEVSSELCAKTDLDMSSWSKDQIGLYSLFKDGEVISTDTLVQISGLSINQIMALLLELEFARAISGLQGGRYEKC